MHVNKVVGTNNDILFIGNLNEMSIPLHYPSFVILNKKK